MSEPNLEAENVKLGALLRESRAMPPLPPRFQEGVWRRIENAEMPARATARGGWLDRLAAAALRPRLALATVVVVILAGAWLGAHEAAQAAHRDAQSRYLAAVAPNSLR